MKKIILLLIGLIPFVSCGQQNDFKYKGELPKGNFYDAEKPFIKVKLEEIDLRNRIYLMFDEATNKLLLNNHEITIDEFETAFKYVLYNFDKKAYLPESVDKTMVFTNLLGSNQFPQKEFQRFKVAVLFRKIVAIYDDLIENEIKNVLKTTWENLTIEEVEQLKNIKPQIAILRYTHLDEAMERLRKLEVEKNDSTNQRNVLSLKINDKLFVRETETEINKLQEIIVRFVRNPTQDSTLAESPKQAIVFLEKDENTSNDYYLTVYNKIKAAYNMLWDKAAIERYGLKYKVLDREIQKEIRADFPMNFLE